MDRMAYPFAPEVALLYNPTSTAISRGEAVKWSTTVFEAKVPEPEDSAELRPRTATQGQRPVGVRGVPGVERLATRYKYGDICGVAMEDIPASAWGHVCLSGVTDVLVAESQTVSKGDGLLADTDASFSKVADPAAATVIHALALEDVTTGAGESAFILAYLPPRPGPFDALGMSQVNT